MTFAGVNYLAILITTIAGFAFGAAYCMSLSKPWLAAIGKTKEEIAAEGKDSLTIIDGIQWLGVLVIHGAIIGAFGV
jgi:hypothetical protein